MADGVKSNKNRVLSSETSSTRAVIGRLKEALGADSDGQLATYLGISRQNIGAARKRDDVPTGWIYKVAEMTGCSMDWLGFGQEPRKRRAAYEEPQPDKRSELASPQAAYKRLTGTSGQSANVGWEHEETASFGAAVEMLAKIYNSGDRTMISSISANIRAFCEILER